MNKDERYYAQFDERVLNYKGYIANVAGDTEDKVFRGFILNANNKDEIKFEAKTVEKLQEEFKKAVNKQLTN